MIQLSRCLKTSVFCPPGFTNETGASQSYYDLATQRAAAQDTYDLGAEGTVYSTDQTFISAFNSSHLLTKLYFLTPGASVVKCFSTLFKASFPSNNPLQDGSVIGVADFDGVPSYKWKGQDGMFYFVQKAPPNALLGQMTEDSSQVNYFKWITPLDIPARAFQEPSGVDCPLQHTSFFESEKRMRMSPLIGRFGLLK